MRAADAAGETSQGTAARVELPEATPSVFEQMMRAHL